MDNIEVKEQANKEITKETTPQEFAEKYKVLCEETGYRIVVAPTWVSTNHGSFEMVLQYTIGKLPQEEVK